MKTTYALISFFFAITTAGFSATSLIGTSAKGLQNNAGSTLAGGNRFIIIVDSGGDGFGAAVTNSIAANVDTTVGQLFGGDLIVGSGSTANAFGASSASGGGASIDISLANKPFALVWFDSVPAATTAIPDLTFYGLATHATWLVSSADGSANGFADPPNVGAGNPYQQIQSAGSATLQIGAVPEPSRAILAGLGLMGLFFRRRR